MKMKFYTHLLIMLLSIVVFSSCGDFLEEYSQSDLVPSTLEDLEAMMYSEAYPYDLTTDVYLDLLTDDIQNNGLTDPENYTSYYDNGTAIFTYNVAMFDGNYTFPTEANSYKIYYEAIEGCNVVKDYVDEVDGTEMERNAMLGQVLFLRGYFYLKLALIYCNIYSANASDDLGLPLVLTMTVSDDFPVRSTLQETYDQIEDDFLQAADLLEANYTADSKFRVDHHVAHAMLSRLYLYMGDYENVVKYADFALAAQPSLTSLESFQSDFQYRGIYDLTVSEEPYWVYGSNSLYEGTYFPTGYYSLAPYTVADTLLSLYEEGDLRRTCYFYTAYAPTGTYPLTSVKAGQYVTTYGAHGIRNAEVYLNRAEASARLFLSTGGDSYRVQALSDLNLLRQNRFSSSTYEATDITDGNELLDFCMKERRRELCLEEGLRWYDIKRLQLSVTHEYIDLSGTTTSDVLTSGDLLYALPIPYDAIERNYKLEQNPR